MQLIFRRLNFKVQVHRYVYKITHRYLKTHRFGTFEDFNAGNWQDWKMTREMQTHTESEIRVSRDKKILIFEIYFNSL